MPKTIYRVGPDEPDKPAAPAPDTTSPETVPPKTGPAEATGDVRGRPSEPSTEMFGNRWIILILAGIVALVIIMVIAIVVLGATDDASAALGLLG